VIQSYVSSFFSKKNSNISIGIARAGNVIGGGDWSENRLIPDCMKSWSKNKKVFLRNPNSTRPWQHVLEAVWGYIVLANKLKENRKYNGEAFNFGPNNKENYKVIYLVKSMQKHWEKISWKINRKKKISFYESKLLKLNSKKSKNYLKWKCILTFKETVNIVANWYKSYYSKSNNMYKISLNQIKNYEKLLKLRSL